MSDVALTSALVIPFDVSPSLKEMLIYPPTLAPSKVYVKRASYRPSRYQASKQVSDGIDWYVWKLYKFQAGMKKKVEI